MTLIAGSSFSSPAETARPPNLVFVLADDLGWQDTSVPFHTERTPLNDRFRTPAMERLAAGGMKFTQAYACAVCTPSRVSWMTGLNAARHRVTYWTLQPDGSHEKQLGALRAPAWRSAGLSPGTPRGLDVTTAPELLRRAGYRTIHVGKAHFGAAGTPGADPRRLGFEVNIGGSHRGQPRAYRGEYGVPHLTQEGGGKDRYLTEALTQAAIGEVRRAKSDGVPFFLYLAHFAVHTPITADPRFVEAYRAAGLDETEAAYASMVEGLDRSLGDLMDELGRLGLEDETVVVFSSDNGGLSAVARGGTPHTHNAPLSSGKGSAREGGIRVPLLVRWPGVTQPGSVCTQCVQIEDLFATFLDMAGVSTDAETVGPRDGVSLAPLLRQAGAYPADRSLLWHAPHRWGPTGPGIGFSSTVRQGPWKLIYYHEDRRYELFDLDTDLGETVNRADTEPQVLARMIRLLRERLIACEAQMPTAVDTGEPVPWPGE